MVDLFHLCYYYAGVIPRGGEGPTQQTPVHSVAPSSADLKVGGREITITVCNRHEYENENCLIISLFLGNYRDNSLMYTTLYTALNDWYHRDNIAV